MKLQKILTAAMVLVSLSACRTEKPADREELTVSSIADALLECYDVPMTEEDSASLENLLRISPDSFSDAKGYLSEEQDGQLLFVAEAADDETAAEIYDAMSYYLSSLQNTASMYSPDELKMLNDGYLVTREHFVILSVCADRTAVEKQAAAIF
ncbi:MAG: DUF4358 domain-containing protein [Erysipelotrichaceae bacterium]|nr:DUF4358 domain-containing protein [Erysipelotrichaceae bacterium]